MPAAPSPAEDESAFVGAPVRGSNRNLVASRRGAQSQSSPTPKRVGITRVALTGPAYEGFARAPIGMTASQVAVD
jgi:hypothetical protein